MTVQGLTATVVAHRRFRVSRRLAERRSVPSFWAAGVLNRGISVDLRRLSLPMGSRLPVRLSVLGLILDVASVAIVWLPSVLTENVTSDEPNRRLSLFAAEGWPVLIPVLVPVVLAFVPVLLRHRRGAQAARIVAAGLLGLGVMLAMASIGLLYLPTLAVLIAAAAAGEARPPPQRLSANTVARHPPTPTNPISLRRR